MNRTIEYQYSHGIVRRAAWHFLLRWGRCALITAVIILLLGLFEVCRGNITWMTIAALLLPLLLPIGWMSYVKRAASVCDAMPDKIISVTFTDDVVRFHTSEHDSEFKWSLIKALWRFKTEWLIFIYSKQNYTLIPTTDLDSRLQDFILTKLKENNTKINNHLNLIEKCAHFSSPPPTPPIPSDSAPGFFCRSSRGVLQVRMAYSVCARWCPVRESAENTVFEHTASFRSVQNRIFGWL